MILKGRVGHRHATVILTLIEGNWLAEAGEVCASKRLPLRLYSRPPLLQLLHPAAAEKETWTAGPTLAWC